MRAAAEEDKGELVGTPLEVEHTQKREDVVTSVDLIGELDREPGETAGDVRGIAVRGHLVTVEAFRGGAAQCGEHVVAALGEEADAPPPSAAEQWPGR